MILFEEAQRQTALYSLISVHAEADTSGVTRVIYRDPNAFIRRRSEETISD